MIIVVCFITLLVNMYDNRPLPLLRSSSIFQIELICSWISDPVAKCDFFGSVCQIPRQRDIVIVLAVDCMHLIWQLCKFGLQINKVKK
jgi:hypothetical protein